MTKFMTYFFVDGKDLGKMLIKAKLAVTYDGGTKKEW